MKDNLLKFIPIFIIGLMVLVDGCCSGLDNSKTQVVRTYAHDTANNVIINIYKLAMYNLMILNSSSDNITINESFYLSKSAQKNPNMFVRDYVKFNGNKTDLLINISLQCYVDSFTVKDSNATVFVYLPNNTNYTVNYLGSDPWY
jgi:hypothetical protein